MKPTMIEDDAICIICCSDECEFVKGTHYQWVGCERCNDWVHVECLKQKGKADDVARYHKAYTNNDPWYCTICDLLMKCQSIGEKEHLSKQTSKTSLNDKPKTIKTRATRTVQNKLAQVQTGTLEMDGNTMNIAELANTYLDNNDNKGSNSNSSKQEKLVLKENSNDNNNDDHITTNSSNIGNGSLNVGNNYNSDASDDSITQSTKLSPQQRQETIQQCKNDLKGLKLLLVAPNSRYKPIEENRYLIALKLGILTKKYPCVLNTSHFADVIKVAKTKGRSADNVYSRWKKLISGELKATDAQTFAYAGEIQELLIEEGALRNANDSYVFFCVCLFM